MTEDQKLKILERHVTQLAEIFDAVQVLATGLDENNETVKHSRGSGNWYARQGMAQEFIQIDIAQQAAHQIAKKLDPPHDE